VEDEEATKKAQEFADKKAKEEEKVCPLHAPQAALRLFLVTV
jgi:hypothetical protein